MKGGVILPAAIYYPKELMGKVGFEPTRAQGSIAFEAIA